MLLNLSSAAPRYKVDAFEVRQFFPLHEYCSHSKFGTMGFERDSSVLAAGSSRWSTKARSSQPASKLYYIGQRRSIIGAYSLVLVVRANAKILCILRSPPASASRPDCPWHLRLSAGCI